MRSDGVRSDGVRSDGVRSDGVRGDGWRHQRHPRGPLDVGAQGAAVEVRLVEDLHAARLAGRGAGVPGRAWRSQPWVDERSHGRAAGRGGQRGVDGGLLAGGLDVVVIVGLVAEAGGDP